MSSRDDLAVGGPSAATGHAGGDGRRPETLEGHPQAQRELAQGHREGRDRRPCGELRDDAEERRDGGSDEQGAPMSPNRGMARGTRRDRYIRVPSRTALMHGM